MCVPCALNVRTKNCAYRAYVYYSLGVKCGISTPPCPYEQLGILIFWQNIIRSILPMKWWRKIFSRIIHIIVNTFVPKNMKLILNDSIFNPI